LRIAIVSNRFAPYVGGNETTMATVGAGLVRRGHAVTVLTRRHHAGLPSREVMNGITVERFGPSGHGVAGKWLMNAGTCGYLLAQRGSIDCVLVSQCSATVVGPAAARALGGAPFVLKPIQEGEISGAVSAPSLSRLPGIVRAGVRWALGRVRRWAFGMAKAMIVASSGLAQEAAEFGFPQGQISIIPNPVDSRRFRPVDPDHRDRLRKELGLPADGEVVSYVTRLVQGKGLLTLVQAWQDVARDRPRAILALVGTGAGPGSPLDAAQSLRAAVDQANLGERVLLAGNRPDVERWLQASDIFAFPSEAEGFGNALVEAMATGLPVVCSRIEGAAADLVAEGNQGLKFDVGDASGLATAIRTLLADEPLRRRMGASGLAIVNQRLGVEAVAAAYEAVLGRVANRS
jgi:glycosyltransferase involved in cell wall biosynthesis